MTTSSRTTGSRTTGTARADASHAAGTPDRSARRITALVGATLAAAAALGVGQATQADAATFPRATVHADGGLISHTAPSTKAPRGYVFSDRAELGINCRTKATRVDGNPNWYLVTAEGDAHWVSGRYLTLHDKAKHCGADVSIPATTTKRTGAFEGPNAKDRYLQSLQQGVGAEVLCYTEPTPGKRWMVTIESGWIRAAALDPDKRVPYCEQS